MVIDGAHNEDALFELTNAVKKYFDTAYKVALFAMMKDKDTAKAAKIVSGFADGAVLTTADEQRGETPDNLQKIFKAAKIPAEAVSNPKEAFDKAIKKARDRGGMVIVCGSIYLAGIIKEQVKNII